MMTMISKSGPFILAALLGIVVAGLAEFQSIRAKESSKSPSELDNTNTDNPGTASDKAKGNQPMTKDKNLSKATFGGGCFWCTEAIYLNVRGVHAVKSGYAGGRVENPTYQAVCSGTTGHAEVIQLQYDPKEIAYPELLEIFWETHDPTTLNRQGNDVGTQYRSVIFYHDDEQQRLAEEYKLKLDESGAFDAPIVTEITKYENFYPAEDYHQNYFNLNSGQPYCMMVVRPKVEKFKKVFPEKLKDTEPAGAASSSEQGK